MTDSTTTSVGGFTVGDHVRMREDADPRAYGRIRGVRFADGVIDRLDVRRSTVVSMRVKGDVRDDGPRDGDWYWYAPYELELVDGEVGPDAGEEDSPEAKPEPAADVPHGLAGLRKLTENTRDAGGMTLWSWLESGTESTWGVDEHSSESCRDTLTRLADEIEAERAQPASRVAGPIERALRDEWGKGGHGRLGEDFTFGGFLDFCESVSTRVDTGTVTGDFFGSLLNELGETHEGPATAPRLPEGVEWPRYEDGTPVRIGDEAYDQPGGFTTEVARVAIRDDQWYLLDSDGYDISWGGRGDHPRRYVAPTPDLQTEDTWDQLREDATLTAAEYCGKYLPDWHSKRPVNGGDEQSAQEDLVRRAERLAKGGE